MIDEEKMINRIIEKCREVKYKREHYQSALRGVDSKWRLYKKKGIALNSVIEKIIDLKDYEKDYVIVRFETKQLCYALGAEYVEIYNRIVGDGEK